MKPKTVLSLAFVACIACMLVLSACEKTDLRDNNSKERDDRIVLRTDCEDCDECCCIVQLNNDNAASLHLCGTADGAAACSGPAICGTGAPNGGGQMISLNSGNTRQVFCMLEDSPLRIRNTSTTDNAGIIISCQNGSMLPQLIQLSIAPLDSVYYDTDDACELTECG